MPALTRSAIKHRSSSATAPRTVKTSFPAGVEVSTCSDKETNSIPKERNVSRARRRWEGATGDASYTPLVKAVASVLATQVSEALAHKLLPACELVPTQFVPVVGTPIITQR
jgi:hypothetical protein